MTHQMRARIHIAQLMQQQARLDDEGQAVTEEQLAYKAYFELLRESNTLLSPTNTPPYQPPPLLHLWKPIDVFIFLKMKQNEDKVGAFLRPIALKRLNGRELLDLVSTEKWVSQCHLPYPIFSLIFLRMYNNMHL